MCGKAAIAAAVGNCTKDSSKRALESHVSNAATAAAQLLADAAPPQSSANEGVGGADSEGTSAAASGSTTALGKSRVGSAVAASAVSTVATSQGSESTWSFLPVALGAKSVVPITPIHLDAVSHCPSAAAVTSLINSIASEFRDRRVLSPSLTTSLFSVVPSVDSRAVQWLATAVGEGAPQVAGIADLCARYASALLWAGPPRDIPSSSTASAALSLASTLLSYVGRGGGATITVDDVLSLVPALAERVDAWASDSDALRSRTTLQGWLKILPAVSMGNDQCTQAAIAAHIAPRVERAKGTTHGARVALLETCETLVRGGSHRVLPFPFIARGLRVWDALAVRGGGG